MKLGERINALRREQGLSQTELAERLQVSRQSVSKWETGASVPELEKLVRMSELFGVTLDDLVNGEEACSGETASAEPEPAGLPDRNRRKLPALVLLCTGIILAALVLLFFGPRGWLYMVILGLPFAACGLILWSGCPHPGLWCAWALQFGVGLYLYTHTAISWQLVLHTIGFSPSDNYARLAIAWAILLVRIVLVVWTVGLAGRGKPFSAEKAGFLGSVLLVLFLIRKPWALQNTWMFLGRFLNFLLIWLRLLFTALVLTVLARRRKTPII